MRSTTKAILAVTIAAAVAAAATALAFAAVHPAPPESPAGAGSGGDRDAPVVAFYGDSYTLGTGASDPSKRWSTIVSADRGWNEFNYSVNGLGFVNNRASTPPDYLPGDGVAEVLALDPDIVVVTMGLNDNFSMPQRATEIREAIRIDFETLARELPEASIVVVEPFWYTDARPESVALIIDWVREAAEDIGADQIQGASRWLEGHPEWMAADGLHPNDRGYAEMASRMDQELAALGL
ncbi:SGNH/GDSL hydrolase family protein [Herbiconiux moechotypicola]|uniref:SGNH/GDSL hydrolase family protein n=1 Tax=Herbiconiux moechotypicola TaxID=637393 RepID=A0ABP5QLD5_9MICO|nr:SGNH/GDSL hydrolase family protein [Herbiconiux moechotypicola]MCS5731463.1 SGNH/GDSL hydrolase family protein [Herbiconiux moechotypicola]